MSRSAVGAVHATVARFEGAFDRVARRVRERRRAGRAIRETAGLVRVEDQLEGAVRGQDQRALDGVRELSNVARPRRSLERAALLTSERRRHEVVPRARPQQQRLGDRDDVLDALSQRRHPRLDDAQSVVQILAKSPFAHERFERAVGGGDDAHVGEARLCSAHALELVGREHAKQPHLRSGRELAHLVEKERRSMRALDDPFVSTLGARKRSALVSEQGALDERLGQRSAVDRQHRVPRARRSAVEPAREQLLSDP